MQTILPAITAFFCLGIIIASKIRLWFFFVYIPAIAVLVSSLFFIKKEKVFYILLFLLFLSLGALLLINSLVLPKNHIANFVSTKGLRVHLEGVIDNDPVSKFENSSFILRAQKLKIGDYYYKVCGRILVKVWDKKDNKSGQDLFYGDRIILEGKLYRPFYFHNGRRLNYKEYLKHKGIYAILSCARNSTIKKIRPLEGNFIYYFAFKIRHRLKTIINNNLSSLSAAILNAIILGLREDLPKQIRDVLINTGTVHIIAISGLHLGIVAFMVLIFLKLIRVPKRPRYVVAILILFFYSILTGLNIPIIRATIMATILLLGYTFNRQLNFYNCLALAALIILFINPWQLFEIAFQLSFLSVFSLIWLSPKIMYLFPDILKKSRYFRPLINVCSCSLAVWFALLPLTAYYFKIISPVAVLANIIAVPYMTLIVACGFSLLLAGIVFPSLTWLFSPAVEASVFLLLKYLWALSRIPLGYFSLP